jgi:hypothetical protein
MRERVIAHVAITSIALGLAVILASPATANTTVRTVYRIDSRYVDSDTCGFDIAVHFFGSFQGTDYIDNTGFLYKTMFNAFGGRLTVTERAKGTTLTTHNVSFQETFIYNPDGSVASDTSHGVVLAFTAPRMGIVLKDVGILILIDGEIAFEHPFHQQIHGDTAEFCAAF